jgi:hypothetical protein
MLMAEETLHFAVGHLRHKGTWHSSGTLSWGNRARVGFRVLEYLHEAEVFLNYEVNGQPVEQRIPCETTEQHWGRRWWFLCPGCGQRMGVLYLAPRRTEFRCRDCYGVRYLSQERTLDLLVKPIMAATGVPRRVALRSLRQTAGG